MGELPECIVCRNRLFTSVTIWQRQICTEQKKQKEEPIIL